MNLCHPGVSIAISVLVFLAWILDILDYGAKIPELPMFIVLAQTAHNHPYVT